MCRSVVEVTVVEKWPSQPDDSKCALVDSLTYNLTFDQCSCSSYTLDVTSLDLPQNNRAIVYSKMFISTQVLNCSSAPDYVEVSAYDYEYSVG